MTVSERIFLRLDQLSMSQKEFSERTGILPSTISEWKKKKTNPLSEKIMPICEALDVTPEWLLSDSGLNESGSEEIEYFTIKRDSELGRLIAYYKGLGPSFRERVMGYVEAFAAMNDYQDNDKGRKNGKKGE